MSAQSTTETETGGEQPANIAAAADQSRTTPGTMREVRRWLLNRQCSCGQQHAEWRQGFWQHRLSGGKHD